MKKVELLYFDGCPSYKRALENLKAVLAEEQIDAHVELINVDSPETAESMGFYGSPSIRIDGVDFEGKTGDYSYACRIFKIDGRITGTPTKDYIRHQILAPEKTAETSNDHDCCCK